MGNPIDQMMSMFPGVSFEDLCKMANDPSTDSKELSRIYKRFEVKADDPNSIKEEAARQFILNMHVARNPNISEELLMILLNNAPVKVIGGYVRFGNFYAYENPTLDFLILVRCREILECFGSWISNNPVMKITTGIPLVTVSSYYISRLVTEIKTSKVVEAHHRPLLEFIVKLHLIIEPENRPSLERMVAGVLELPPP